MGGEGKMEGDGTDLQPRTSSVDRVAIRAELHVYPRTILQESYSLLQLVLGLCAVQPT